MRSWRRTWMSPPSDGALSKRARHLICAQLQAFCFQRKCRATQAIPVA